MPPFNINDYVLWAGTVSDYIHYLESRARIEMQDGSDLMNLFSDYDKDDEDEDRFQGMGYMIEDMGEGLARVQIRGSLVSSSSFWTRIYGMTGYDEIRNAVIAAGSDSEINRVLLDIDSPGGSAKGVDEAADAIREVDQHLAPVTSFTAGSMTSAAYWLGSSARDVYATEMATVGSIGVILVHQEYSKMLAEEGITPTVFTAGKYKGIGNPYEKLTDFDKDVIQGKMDGMYDHFVGVVAKNRERTSDYIKENAAEGQTFWGKEALGIGLIDGVKTFDEVVKLIDKDHNSPKSGDQFGLQTGATTMLRKKAVTITADAQAAIAAGVPEEEALAQHAAPAPEEEEEGNSASETESQAEGTEATSETEETEETEEKEEGSGVGASESILVQELSAANQALGEVRAQLAAANVQTETLEKQQERLCSITNESLQRLQVAIGAAAVDHSHLSADLLIQTYDATMKTFLKRFPVGGIAQTPLDEEKSGHGKTVVPLTAPAAARATKIRQGE